MVVSWANTTSWRRLRGQASNNVASFNHIITLSKIILTERLRLQIRSDDTDTNTEMCYYIFSNINNISADCIIYGNIDKIPQHTDKSVVLRPESREKVDIKILSIWHQTRIEMHQTSDWEPKFLVWMGLSIVYIS